MAVRYCLVAGSGDLVTQVVRVATARGVPLTILSLAGQTSVAGQPAHCQSWRHLSGAHAVAEPVAGSRAAGA